VNPDIVSIEQAVADPGVAVLFERHQERQIGVAPDVVSKVGRFTLDVKLLQDDGCRRMPAAFEKL